MSDIDWNEAPEGAEFYSEKGGCFFKIIMGAIYAGFSNRDESWALTRHASVNPEWVHKPSKPAYTQAMADNGELPPIGSNFIDVEFNINQPVLAIAHDLPLNRVIYKAGETLEDVEYFVAVASECKPIEPPIELIDGKAYQFEVGSRKIEAAIYFEETGRFHRGAGFFQAIQCTNIVLLTPEVKS